MGKPWYEVAWGAVCDGAEAVGDAACAVGDNFMDAMNDSKEMYKSASEAWKDGNYLGAVHRGFMGTAAGAGNIITVGGAHKLGEVINDDLDSGNPTAASKVVGYFARNEAESMLIQDDLADGRYVEYEYNAKTNTLEVAHDSNGNALITEAQTDEDKQKFRNIMHGMAGIDIAGDVFDIATLGFGGKGASTAGKAAAKQGGKQVAKTVAKEGAEEIAEASAKQVAKTVAKEGAQEIAEAGTKQVVKAVAKEGAEEVVEAGTKQVAKTVVKEGAEEIAEAGTKQVAKTVAKEGAEEVAEAGAKQVVKTVAKEGAEEVVEQGGKKAAKTVSEQAVKRVTLSGVKDGMKRTAGKGVALFVGSRVINGQTVADANIYGGAYAASHAATDIVDNGVDITVTAVKDAGGFVSNSLLAKFPGLGKFVNTCRAAGYATAKSFAHSSLGAGAVAVVVKPFDFIKSKIKDRQGEYFGKGIGDVAKQIHEDSLKDGKSWKTHYVERVSELDKSIGIDPNKRSAVANYNAGDSGKSSEGEPSFA